MNDALIRLDGVSVGFAGQDVLQDVQLSLRPGEIVTLIGPNGAGKTTVFNCLTGFYQPTGGVILLDDEPIQHLPGHKIARKGVVRTFQNVRLFKEMTAVENLLVAQHRHLNTNFLAGLLKTPSFRRSEKAAMEYAAHWLEQVNLTDVANRPAGTLAYGQQRRLEIARCMMTRPRILMLDEPAAGLNPRETEDLKQLIGMLRMIDEVVCTPFKEHSDIITDILLLGMCNADEGMNPFGRFGQMQLAMEQSLSPSYNLGVLWEPTEDFSFGMVYQSAAKMRLKGKYHIDNAKAPQEMIKGLMSSPTGQILASILGFPSSVPASESGLVAMDFEYPAHFQAGVKYKLMPDLQVNFDVGWTDYKAWDKFRFEFDRQISALKIAKLLSENISDSSLALPLEFTSPWNFGIGLEYSATDRLKLRAGYEPRASAIPDGKRNTMIPINGAQLFGLGVGYRFDADTDLDLSIGFLRSKDNIPANSSSMANQTGVNNILLNPYAGLNVKTDTKITILGLNYRTRW